MLFYDIQKDVTIVGTRDAADSFVGGGSVKEVPNFA